MFQLVTLAMARAAGCADLVEYAERLQGGAPLAFEGNPVRQIASGMICLNDPELAKGCLAFFEVGQCPPRLASEREGEPAAKAG